MEELSEKELFEKVPVPRAVARLIVPTNVVFMVINILAYGYGDAAVSAYGIVKRLDQIPLGMSLGLSQGVMPLIA